MKPTQTDPTCYEIRVEGHLPPQWADWFDGLTITAEADGVTLLTGAVMDQAALHGLLKKVRDLGLPLVSVSRVQFQEAHLYRSERGTNMNTDAIQMRKNDTRTLLSTLWGAVTLSMLKADILSLYIPGSAEEVAKTSAGAGVTIPQLMLGGAIMGELAIVMIVLSRVLKRGVNRWVNILVGAVTIAYIWGGAASYLHYTFIAVVETICLLLIMWNAWTWRNVEA